MHPDTRHKPVKLIFAENVVISYPGYINNNVPIYVFNSEVHIERKR